jgi:hypothetical protein
LTRTNERRRNGCEKGGEDNTVLMWAMGPSKKGDFFARRDVFSLDLPFNG